MNNQKSTSLTLQSFRSNERQSIPAQSAFDIRRVLFFGCVWAIIGILYSAILVAVLAFFRHLELGPIAIGLAASLAGGVGALFYGSLRLAFLAALAAIVAAFAYLAVHPMQTISPYSILLVTGVAGAIVGGYYGYLMKGSRVCHATGKALAGLYAGFVAGMPLTALAGLQVDVSMGLSAAILTPLTGLIYVLSVRYMVENLCGQPPTLFSAALVGAGVAGLIGISVWAFVGILSSTVIGNATDAVRFGWAVLPHTALGGMVGGFLGGSLFAAAGLRLTHNH